MSANRGAGIANLGTVPSSRCAADGGLTIGANWLAMRKSVTRHPGNSESYGLSKICSARLSGQRKLEFPPSVD